MRRPRIGQCRRHCSDPASLPDGAGSRPFRPNVTRSTTSGPEDTEAIAAALARELRAGDVVLVAGEVGAGKTTFVRGAVRELGHPGRVTSPTFTMVNRYEG